MKAELLPRSELPLYFDDLTNRPVAPYDAVAADDLDLRLHGALPGLVLQRVCERSVGVDPCVGYSVGRFQVARGVSHGLPHAFDGHLNEDGVPHLHDALAHLHAHAVARSRCQMAAGAAAGSHRPGYRCNKKDCEFHLG